MHYQLDGNELGLMGYWTFNEGSGSQVLDYSGRALNSTLFNGAYWDNNIPILNVRWLSICPNTGTLSSGDSSNITVTFNPAGLDSAVYHATILVRNNDPSQNVVSIPVTLTTFIPNRPPVAVDDIFYVIEDSPSTLVVTANDYDPNSQPITIVDVSGPFHSSVSIYTVENSIIHYPAHNFFGPDSFTYALSDGELTDTAMVHLTISPSTIRLP